MLILNYIKFEAKLLFICIAMISITKVILSTTISFTVQPLPAVGFVNGNLCQLKRADNRLPISHARPLQIKHKE